MKIILILILFTGTILQAFSQNVGIGTTTPLARLHVKDSGVLFSATGVALVNAADVPVSGAGRRMLWYADKGAFRAGYVSGLQWDTDSIGAYSVAMGFSTVATASRSTAFGYATAARGQYATALGSNTIASGESSIAFGSGTIASGFKSIALGNGSQATAPNSISIGYFNTASSDGAIAMGSSCTASEYGNVAMGDRSHATGLNSYAIGAGVYAKARGGAALGQFNNSSDNSDPYTANATDRIFQLGNGSDFTTRSNAITVLRNGNTGLGIIAPQSILHLVGEENDGTDATLKIQSGSQRLLFDGNEIDAYTTTFLPNSMYLQNNSAGDIILVSGGGKVGININPTVHALEVNGTAAKPGGGSWTALSDARMKQQIKPYTDGLQKILQIDPVTFHYNNLSGYNTADEHVGILAQQLKTIAPYMTGTIQKDGQEYLTADNSAMIYMLINGMKELAKKNEKLEADMEELKKTVK
ncbi:MAG: tail fiber domain-containing protein [Bacteroidota bacterium]